MDWSAWRDEFPILSRRTYLNSCSLGALSRRSEARLHGFLAEWHEHGASAWYDIWWGRLSELRSRVASLLGAADGEVALCASVSAALAVVASAVDYRRRPRVVVSELDFPTLSYQWLARPGLEVVRVPSDDGVGIDPGRFADAVDDRTAVLATSHVFFTTGAIQALPALAEIAHRRGALFVVDAYQSVGQIPVDAPATGADVLLTGPLKWLLGGPGLAYAWVRDDRIPTLRPTTTGWFAAADQFAFEGGHLRFHDDARRFELGTPALATVHTALGGQEIVDEVGMEAIALRNRGLVDRLVDGALAAGFRLRVAPDAAERTAIVMVAEEDPEGAVEHLARRGVVVDARPGHVRLSPHFYNTEEDIDAALEGLRSWRETGR